MNQFLYDDDQLIWVFNEEDEARYKKTFFTRFEEYSLFQGLKRENTSTDYLNFVKLYIRADTKKTEVKRTYEKFNEFFADDFSLLIVVYEVLNAIFELLNTFWKEQSLAKNIFFFQDFDHKLHINHKSEKIKELLQLTDPDRINNITLPKNTDSDKPVDTIQNFENEKIIYTTKEGHYTSKNIPTFNNIITQNEDTSDEIDGKYQKISNSYRGREYNMNIKTDISFTKRSRNNELCETNQFTNTNRNLYTITNNKDKETTLEDNDVEKIEYEYNLYEKIKTIICKCCLSKELKVKNTLNEKAMSILDDKLDIVLFVRNMMLIDIINATLLDTETDDIVNFLARPIITLKDDEDDEFSMLYHKYKETDFEKFYKEIVHLSNKPNKRMEEIKLISICNKHLKSINI